MYRNFDEIFDQCVDRLNRGQSLEDCLADYPEQAAELEPLLRAMVITQEGYAFVPSPLTKDAARQRFNAALAELERQREARQPLFWRLFGQPRVWAPAVLIMVIALIGYFGLRPMLLPLDLELPIDAVDITTEEAITGNGEAPVIVSPQANPMGYFAFLISDERNDINDFASLNVTISKIVLKLGGDDDRWVEIVPLVDVVDLTLLQGDKAQEIWRGDIPLGEYDKVLIHVDNITGILADGGGTANVTLPSDKLQISTPFTVGDRPVNFVYDLTVVATGSPQGDSKYILRPQAGESGANQRFELVGGQDKGKGKDKDGGKGKQP